jgi:hypothetical protein
MVWKYGSHSPHPTLLLWKAANQGIDDLEANVTRRRGYPVLCLRFWQPAGFVANLSIVAQIMKLCHDLFKENHVDRTDEQGQTPSQLNVALPG